MRLGRRLLIWMWLLCCSTVAVAQQQEYTWDDFVRDFSLDEETDNEETRVLYLQDLRELHEHPLNINTAGIDDLLQLPFLSETQIEEIHAYIYLHGNMQTLGELMLLPRMDAETRRKLSLFVYAGQTPPTRKDRIGTALRHDISSRMDIPLYYRKGYQVEDGYRGDALYHRIKYALHDRKHLRAGLRIEKDPGERFYDSYGAYAMLQDIGILKTAVIGDFRAGFGEGLVMGGNTWLSKSTPQMKTGSGIRPMTGMDEVNFLRGGAVALKAAKDLEVGVWLSHRKLDATLNNDGEIQTLVSSGYHRTHSEWEKRRNAASTLAGGHLMWRKEKFHIGATGYMQHFGKTLNPGDATYRRFYPRGKDIGVMGVNYGYRLHRFSLAGETAYSTAYGGWAALHRAQWHINRNYTLSALHRYYARDYYSFQASAISENSTVQNENGVLLHLKGTPAEGWTVSGYADFFYHPWPRFGLTHSSSGQELMGQVEYKWNVRNSLFARYQWKRKERYDVMEPHHRIKMQWNLHASDAWKWQTTGLWHQTRGGTGMGIQQGVLFCSKQPALRLAAMLGYFHTDNYNCRIYLYEPALYSSVSSASYYGHGLHSTLTARWTSPNGTWMLEGRYKVNRMLDRDTQSSGLQTIFSPWKNDLSLQLRVRI